VTCLIPGEGAGVGDVAQCLGCIGGIPSTIALIYWAKDACEKAGNCGAVDKLQKMQEQIEELQQKIKDLQDQIQLR
jgi:hypothetical protein